MRLASSIGFAFIGLMYFALAFAHWSTGIRFSWIGGAFAALLLCRGVFNLIVAQLISHDATAKVDGRFHGAAYAIASFVLVLGSLAEQRWSLFILAMTFAAIAVAHILVQSRHNPIAPDA